MLSLLSLNKIEEIDDLILNNYNYFLVPKLFECINKLE